MGNIYMGYEHTLRTRVAAGGAHWPVHDIAITNIVWQVLQYRMVGGKHYIAQKGGQ